MRTTATARSEPAGGSCSEAAAEPTAWLELPAFHLYIYF
jgi:hypothetical protein